MYQNPMMNQLLRNRDQIDSLIQQYNQPTPIQNFINTAGLDFEAKILSNGEDYSNIAVTRRTLFVDEKNHKVVVKEMDGSISKEYEIVIPKDAKDLKIEELENKLKKMEERLNEYPEYDRSTNERNESNVNANGDVESTTKTST